MEKREYTEPVKHIVFDDFLGAGELLACADDVKANNGQWITYDNADEKKMTCNNPLTFGPTLQKLFTEVQGDAFTARLSGWFGISPLQSDPLLHGGGIHRSGPGGTLSIHLDYARHCKFPHLERRINAIVYLVPEWREEWGGATVLTKPDGVTVLNRVYPKPGRLLVFETNDLSYHGVEPITCPEGVERVTLATYYLSPIRDGVTRERALFIPNRKAS